MSNYMVCTRVLVVKRTELSIERLTIIKGLRRWVLLLSELRSRKKQLLCTSRGLFPNTLVCT